MGSFLKYPFEIFLALRYLGSKRKRGAISVLTWLSVVCVAIGVMALNVVLSVMHGFEEDLKSRIVGLNAHIIVSGFQNRPIADADSISETIRQMEHVRSAGPYVQGQVMLRSKERAMGAVAWGLDPDHPEAIAELDKYLWNAKTIDLKPPATEGQGRAERIFLGARLAQVLQVSVGDDILVFLPIFQQTPMGMVPRSLKCQVVGLFSMDMYDYDSGYVYLPLSVAQRMYDLAGNVTGIAVKVDDVDRASEVAKAIREKFHGDYYVRDWLQMNMNFFTAVRIEELTMGIILSLIILVAAISIVSSLTMMVIEKTREIGILKAMGSTDKSVSTIFIVEGMIVGAAGIVLGVFLGFILCEIISRVYIHMPGGGSVYIIDRLPVRVQPLLNYFVVPILSIVLCFLATLYPARQAAKMEPVEAIRFG